MKKILLMTMLTMQVITGTFAKDKKVKTEEPVIEVSADVFFNKNFTAQKGTVYKITDIELLSNVENKILIRYHDCYRYCDSHSKPLSNEEMSRIEKAEEFELLRTNYIIYAQTNTSKPEPKNLRVIKIENIPTIDDISEEIKKQKAKMRLAEEEARLAAEREAEEQNKIDEMKSRVKKEGGYDNMPWGTIFDDFLLLHPYLDIHKEENEGSLIVYSKKGPTEDSELFYKFFEGKLVGGKTVFSSQDEITGDAIIHRLIELYGESNDIKCIKEDKIEKYWGGVIPYTETHIKTIWNKSPNFRVTFDVCILNCDTKIGMYDIADLNMTTFSIIYSNPAMASKIASADMEVKKKEEAARKAQEEMELRKRMDSLGL